MGLISVLIILLIVQYILKRIKIRKNKEIYKSYEIDWNQPTPSKESLDPWDQSLSVPLEWNKTLLNSLEWKRYEEVCAEYLKIKNCSASVTCIGADGGIDIEIHDEKGQLFAIGQCKAWSKPAGVSLIRELYGVMISVKAEYGIFLTTSFFTPDAIAFSKNKPIVLIDADEFIKLINELSEDEKAELLKIATDGDYTTPTCVRCNVKMIKKTAKTGINAGNTFWGCINYPRCKQKLFIRK